MSLEDEARAYVGQRAVREQDEARIKALQDTPVFLDWARELAASLGKVFPHQPLYRHTGHELNKHIRTNFYERMGRGWALSCFYRDDGYKMGKSAVLMADGVLRSSLVTEVTRASPTNYFPQVGLDPGTSHALVAGPFLINAANAGSAEAAEYRTLFGVNGVAALLDGNIQVRHGVELTWWDPNRL